MLLAAAMIAGLPMAAAAGYLAPHALRVPEVRALRRRCRESRSLVLTYDDGPGPVLTCRLLTLLAEHQAKASFFMLGSKIEKNRELVKRLGDEGHEIGCHGFSHANAWTSLPANVIADMTAGYRAVEPFARPNCIFRPPFGKTSIVSRAMLWRRSAPLAWWTIDSGDTAAVLPDPRSVVEQLRREQGGVVLLHDFDRNIERVEYVLHVTRLLLECAAQHGLTICRQGDLPSAN